MVNFAMEVVIQRANIPVGKSFDSVSAAGNYRRATLEIRKWCSPRPNQKFPTFIPPYSSFKRLLFLPLPPFRAYFLPPTELTFVPIKIPIPINS